MSSVPTFSQASLLDELIELHGDKVGFPGGSAGKESANSAGDLALMLGLRRSPGKRNGNALKYSCLRNPRDKGAWWAIGHGVREADMT